jgi:pantoate--beta-alanine ligase
MKNGMSFSSRYNKFSTLEENIFNQVANFLKISIEDLRNNFNINIMISIKKGLKDIGIKKIDYVELKDEINLQSTLKKKNSRLFIAFYIGKIRIIDNFILY